MHMPSFYIYKVYLNPTIPSIGPLFPSDNFLFSLYIMIANIINIRNMTLTIDKVTANPGKYLGASACLNTVDAIIPPSAPPPIALHSPRPVYLSRQCYSGDTR